MNARTRTTVGAAAACALPALAGCATDGPQNFMRGAGPAARSLAALGWFALAAFTATTIVVWALIWWLALRCRGSLDAHAPVDANGGQSWIVVGGVAIPALVFGTLFVASLDTMAGFPLAHAGHGESADEAVKPAGTTIRVVGRQWWFGGEYLDASSPRVVHVPTEIHVPTGCPVDILLETRDVIHSFWIPKLHGKVDLIPGVVNRVRIQADEPGTYFGQCGEFCGEQHANMRVYVVAQEGLDYRRWLAAQAAPAHAPSTAQQARGRELFEGGPCAVCHTIRGTEAAGRIGPDLTHVGSRRYIAGGMLPNNTANLAAWITHAQSLKPGSQMPDLTAFDGVELRALVAYLQSLE